MARTSVRVDRGDTREATGSVAYEFRARATNRLTGKARMAPKAATPKSGHSPVTPDTSATTTPVPARVEAMTPKSARAMVLFVVLCPDT